MAASAHQSNKMSRSFFYFFPKFIVISLTFVVYALIVPCIFILVLPLYIYRLFVICLAKVLKPHWVGIMSTRDAVVGLDDVTQRCECMINIMLTYHGNPDLQKIRKVFQENVVDATNEKGVKCYLKLKQYFEPWLGFAFWKWDENFKLENHVKFYEDTLEIIPSDDNNNNDGSDKSNEVMTEEKIMKILGPLSTKKFPANTPPWEVLIVKNYEPAQPQIHKDFVPSLTSLDANSDSGLPTPKFVLILRIHHAIGDGYSIMKLIMAHLSGEPVTKVPKAPQSPMKLATKVLTLIGVFILTPYFHLKQFILEIDRNFWHLPSNKLSKIWHTTLTEKIPLSRLKEISKRHNVTVTAVLLAGFAGGIRRFLEKEGKSKFIPRVMRGLSPMPWKNHPMEALVNHWTIGIFAIPVGGECPRERLKRAHQSAKDLKNSPILFTNFGTVPLLLAVPRWLTDIWATNWMTTMILSNFPGPPHAITGFGEYFQEDVAFWLPQMRGTASMGVAFLSYNGAVRVALTIDSSIIPEQTSASKLNQYISEEFQLLKTVYPASDDCV